VGMQRRRMRKEGGIRRVKDETRRQGALEVKGTVVLRNVEQWYCVGCVWGKLHGLLESFNPGAAKGVGAGFLNEHSGALEGKLCRGDHVIELRGVDLV